MRADECLLPNGNTISPYYVLEESDWVHIVAFNENQEILVTTQYRYAGNQVCLEIPCGAIDDGESPLEAAKRELNEETGYEAMEWTLVFTPFANPARQTNKIYCFRATQLRKVGPQNLDDAEDIDFEFIQVSELKEKIFRDEFQQALHIASVFASIDYD